MKSARSDQQESESSHPVVPLFDLQLRRDEINAVLRVLESGWLTQGPVTEEFERAFSRRLGASGAVAVSSATAGLHLALSAMGVGPGVEVVLPSLTFVATAAAVVYCGGIPVFADIDSPEHPLLTPESIQARLSPATRAVLAVHYGGYLGRIDEISALCADRGIALVEDAAHAPGARLGDLPAGRFGDASVFSFYSNKNFTTGEGGMVVAREPEILAQIRLLRSHALSSTTQERDRGASAHYDVLDLGYNYRTDEMRSALGLAQLSGLEAANERRRRLVDVYREGLQETPGVSIPFQGEPGLSSCHLMPILLLDRGMRQVVAQSLRRSGIQSGFHYPPIHLFTHYRKRFGTGPGLLPVTESYSERELTLPLFPQMTERQQNLVIAAVKNAVFSRRVTVG